MSFVLRDDFTPPQEREIKKAFALWLTDAEDYMPEPKWYADHVQEVWRDEEDRLHFGLTSCNHLVMRKVKDGVHLSLCFAEGKHDHEAVVKGEMLEAWLDTFELGVPHDIECEE